MCPVRSSGMSLKFGRIKSLRSETGRPSLHFLPGAPQGLALPSCLSGKTLGRPARSTSRAATGGKKEKTWRAVAPCWGRCRPQETLGNVLRLFSPVITAGRGMPYGIFRVKARDVGEHSATHTHTHTPQLYLAPMAIVLQLRTSRVKKETVFEIQGSNANLSLKGPLGVRKDGTGSLGPTGRTLPLTVQGLSLMSLPRGALDHLSTDLVGGWAVRTR